MARYLMITFVLLAAVACVAQSMQVSGRGLGNDCTPAGTWYGGSVVGYQFTIIPSGPAGHFQIIFQGIYKAPGVGISSAITGQLEKKGNVYVGTMLSLVGDSSFVDLPPAANGKMPDLQVGSLVVEMVDCNTLKNTIPFFGTYFGANIWGEGTPWTGPSWVPNGKVPMVDAPDIDWIPILTGDTKPIVETYHRLPRTVTPSLLHH